MRLVAGSDETFLVRWYFASPSAKWMDRPHAFLSSKWDGDGEHFGGAGEVADPCYPSHSSRCDPPAGQQPIGEPSWFLRGIPADRLSADDTLPCSGCDCMAVKWAELIQRDYNDAKYGWWELRCDPDTGILVRGPTSWRHWITDDPAWEVAGKLGLPVPGTIVRMHEGCDGRPWIFKHDTLSTFVRLNETNPSVELPNSDRLAYLATLVVADLSGPPGSETVTGTFDGAREVLALDLAELPSGPLNSPFVGRLIGRANGKEVYAFRQSESGGASCSGCTVSITIPEGSDPNWWGALLPRDDAVIYVLLQSDGTVVRFQWLLIGGTWYLVNLCTCQARPELWYCTPTGCVPYLNPPTGLGEGFPTQEACEEASSAGAWWCIPGDPPTCEWRCVPPEESCGGPYATQEACEELVDAQWWCVDEEEPAPWWCVETPTPGGGTSECEVCPEGSPLVWSAPVGSVTGYWSALTGNRSLSWQAYGRQPPHGGCVWSDFDPVARPWSGWLLAREGGVWWLLGYLADGSGVTFRLVGSFNCCAPNTFDFFGVWGRWSEPVAWTGPTEITITPGSDCSPAGEAIMECVQSQTSPPNAVSGPYASEELCDAACGEPPPPTDACCEPGIGSSIGWSVESLSADCTCVSIPFTGSASWDGDLSAWTWSGAFSGCGSITLFFRLRCINPSGGAEGYQLEYGYGDPVSELCTGAAFVLPVTTPPYEPTCSPVSVYFVIPVGLGCCEGGSGGSMFIRFAEV